MRVLYRWRVTPDAAALFPSWWHNGTERIRSNIRGALGSTLLRSHDDPLVFVGVARWRTLEALQDFWRTGGSSGLAGAELERVEVFEELDDLTISQDGSI